MTLHLNLGSNLGDRRLNIERAVARIFSLPWVDEARCLLSSYYESEPWGFDSDNRFVNRGMMISTDMDIAALDILHQLQLIEREINRGLAHRDNDGNYIDRLLDIDIVAIDDKLIDCEELKVPHPLMHRRNFVLIPLAELQPDWRHPVLGLTASQLLVQLSE